MSFWDRFKPSAPTRQPLPEIKLAHKPGTLYYLRARNLYSGFDDVLCFEDETSRQHYMDYGRMSTPNPSDWYFTYWEETADERAQAGLADQRKALLASFETDRRNLQHRLQQTLQKYNDSKDSIAQLQKQVESLTYDYKEYKYKYEQTQDWQSKYNALADKYNFIVNLIEHKRKAPATPTPDTKKILQAIQKDLHTILCKANPEVLEQYAQEYRQELDKLGKHATPLQRGLTLAIIARHINNI